MKIENILPGNIQSLQPYAAGLTIAEVQKRYNPRQISKLASNENRLGCSTKVFTAVQQALNEVQDYPDPAAKRLGQKITNKYQIPESEILIAAGSESIISILCRTFFQDNENAITAEATFVGFFVQAGMRGIELKKVSLTKDYRFDVKAILRAVDADTKMIYIANPNNPTGTYITKKEYRKLCSELPENVFLIMDEAYHEFAQNITDYPSSLHFRQENVITLRTFSKAYGLAGLRIGYAVADERLVWEMMKTKLTFEPTTLAQAAAVTAFDDPPFIEKSVRRVVEGRQQLYDFFGQQNSTYVPSISNAVMMILDNEQQAVEFTQMMLEQCVILRRVHAFGLPNRIRITIGSEREMRHFEESFMAIYQAFESK